MGKENIITSQGEVIEVLPDAKFRVKIDRSDQELLAYSSGKMRRYRIRLIEGDRVIIEISPYDLTRGRIIRRL